MTTNSHWNHFICISCTCTEQHNLLMLLWRYQPLFHKFLINMLFKIKYIVDKNSFIHRRKNLWVLYNHCSYYYHHHLSVLHDPSALLCIGKQKREFVSEEKVTSRKKKIIKKERRKGFATLTNAMCLGYTSGKRCWDQMSNDCGALLNSWG